MLLAQQKFSGLGRPQFPAASAENLNEGVADSPIPTEVETNNGHPIDDRLPAWCKLVDLVSKHERRKRAGEQKQIPNTLPFKTSGMNYKKISDRLEDGRTR